MTPFIYTAQAFSPQLATRQTATACRSWLLALITCVLVGCGGGSGGSSDGIIPVSSASPATAPTDPGDPTTPDPDPPGDPSLDAQLKQVATAFALTGDPAAPRQAQQKTPDQSPLLKLGQLLFYSHSLSGDLTTSCATCHHPDFGGSDRLSISIGVAPQDAAALGPFRQLNPANDKDPDADGGPNMHRNSQTIFNSALYDRALLYDGRVFVEEVETDTVPGGQGQRIRTPETGNLPDVSGASGLLEHMITQPFVNHNEMRAYLFDEPSTDAYRNRLAKRLRQEIDLQFLKPGAAANWLTLFEAGFEQPGAAPEQLVSMLNIQKALAAFIKSMIFVDTPWKRYLEGDTQAISEQAKQGAMLFLVPQEHGGLGCAQCHSGDFFTNEKFYNVGFPQIGRGFQRPEGDDIGRWPNTRRDEDKFAFRVPSLLNVGLTGPYGHAGTFETLADTIRYHAHPREQVNHYDFTLSHLSQFQSLAITYPKAEAHTRNAIAQSSFDIAETLLPQRDLSDNEINQLVAFLYTLSDDCLGTPACRNQWVPALNEDPDGNLLVRDMNPAADPVPPFDPIPDPGPGTDPEPPPSNDPTVYPKQVPLAFADLPAASTFQEAQHCGTEPDTTGLNSGLEVFALRSLDPFYGINDLFAQPLHPHGFTFESWGGPLSPMLAQTTMFAGGVSAAYLDDDCWLDLAYTGGDTSGMVFYINQGGNSGFDAQPILSDTPGGQFTGVMSVDLNGDYRRELLFGNLNTPALPVYALEDDGRYHRIANIPMSRYTYGMSFGDYDGDNYPELYFGHWFLNSNLLTAPVFWKNHAGTALEHYDTEAKLAEGDISQFWNFSPQFADIDQDGHTDLVVASDFGTSLVLHNNGDGTFNNITDRTIITDENGMGSALGDYDNDGDLDWFVSSIYDPDQNDGGNNWGVTGNRLYRNTSTPGVMQFEDVTAQAGVADGNWGWGACFADFNNDGFLDLFHVNGFGDYPEEIIPDDVVTSIANIFRLAGGEYIDTLPRLFINNGDGTFTEKAVDSGIIAPNDGRGISCADLDRDGDIDLVMLHHSHGLQVYENQVGHGSAHRFLSVHLVGTAPNTEALGTKVTLTADTGSKHGVQTQTRVRLAHTTFNGQHQPDLHFGVGEALVADTLTLDWPDGSRLVCNDVATNQFLVFDQRTPGATPDCQFSAAP